VWKIGVISMYIYQAVRVRKAQWMPKAVTVAQNNGKGNNENYLRAYHTDTVQIGRQKQHQVDDEYRACCDSDSHFCHEN